MRTIIDSSMAIFGPDWFKQMKVCCEVVSTPVFLQYSNLASRVTLSAVGGHSAQDDPWGSIKSKVPDSDSNSKTAGDYLLPNVEDWSITSDDMSAYYEVGASEWAVSILFRDRRH